MTESSYTENLIKTVIDSSDANHWDSAVHEWRVIDEEEDTTMSTSCICGHEGIRYLYTIQNINNNNRLFPIGSECIKKFQIDELSEHVNITEQMFKLLHAIEDNQWIDLKSGLFSRKLIQYFYEEGVFEANSYNNYNGLNDMQFLLDMFNKRSTPTDKQNKKIRGLIGYVILPYLENKMTVK
ncbi:hypothetical protein [Leuconostoc pseudomesenteroides]|uniref:hypothetical protein n=1 Tax=Leuconostoc pseudomesenteroides TaxID=33968 RepID=UPI0039EC14F6